MTFKEKLNLKNALDTLEERWRATAETFDLDKKALLAQCDHSDMEYHHRDCVENDSYNECAVCGKVVFC